MDTKQKYMTEIAPNKVTLSINFINQLEQCKEVRWRDIVDMVEFMDNRIIIEKIKKRVQNTKKNIKKIIKKRL